ncbi:amidoligase family protein [Sulfurimonas diazotrophicus]|uniref:Amidoligase family protein n=1 Tax=Sulfurimonas diazotrophicus TaxID=3131939 RepID=A0ABZ3HA30_9BACT
MTPFLLPPKVRCSDGEMRRVGFELEYSGPELESCARIVSEITGGEITEINPWHYTIGPTPWGDFSLTLDFQFLIRSGLQEWLHNAGFDEAMEQDEIDAIEYFIGSFSASLVPFELTTPPLPLNALDLVETLKDALRGAGALGTTANPLYVFGFHINPEAPDLSAATLLAYLRAYLVLYDLLAEEIRPVFTRRLSFYIDPFPSDYIRKVLHPAYRPTMEGFTDDYLEANPTRNRALDLLPLLAWNDLGRVRRALPTEKISPRPAFHFRLPNSRVDEAGWHTADAWNSWLHVERLAEDTETLLSLAYARYRMMNSFFYRFRKKQWIKRIRQWAEKFE